MHDPFLALIAMIYIIVNLLGATAYGWHVQHKGN